MILSVALGADGRTYSLRPSVRPSVCPPRSSADGDRRRRRFGLLQTDAVSDGGARNPRRSGRMKEGGNMLPFRRKSELALAQIIGSSVLPSRFLRRFFLHRGHILVGTFQIYLKTQ